MNDDSIKKEAGQVRDTKSGLSAPPLSQAELDINESHRTRGLSDEGAAIIEIKETGELARTDVLVLVVDDVIDNAVLLSLNLQQQGYKVITASNGEEAIRVATLMRPSIILMDIGMPELDGFGATRKIREDVALRSIPVIAVTAFNTAGFRRAAYDAGFDGYITKPIDFQQLHDLMNRLLS